ncbi:MAG: hypothetical protein LC802_12035 [Acidobacteria bacterium]|nr:hypothetical protein [Acidobacteriota bacterium]
MSDDVRVLRLVDMLLRRKGPPLQRLLHAFISIALRLFFRRIETSRASLVPPEGPLIFVLNHPNGGIDPALVFAALPRRISYAARRRTAAHAGDAAALPARGRGGRPGAEPSHV